MGRDGSGHAVAENNDEEEEEGDRETDGKEVGEDEVPEGQSPAGLSGVLGFGVRRSREGKQILGPASTPGAESHCRCS